jgi:hypothetical protein
MDQEAYLRVPRAGMPPDNRASQMYIATIRPRAFLLIGSGARPHCSRAPEPMFQLPLISADGSVIAKLSVLDVYALSPLAGLNKLYELQQRVKG